MAKPPKPPRRPQIKIKRPIKTAYGMRLEAQRKSLMKVRKGTHRKAKRRIEVEAHVISPRGRPLVKGAVSPFEKPPKEMPQGTQDYFLSSRSIRRRAYDQNNRILEILFTNGYGYQFYGVPYIVWINFLRAQSAGRFFMDHIYGEWRGPKGNMTYFPNYTYRRVA